MCRLLQQCLRSHLLVDLHPAQQLALDSVISVIGVCDSVTSAAGVYERCLLCCLLQQCLRSHLLVDPNTPVGTDIATPVTGVYGKLFPLLRAVPAAAQPAAC